MEVKMDYFYENRTRMLKDNIPLSIYLNTDFSFRAHWHTDFELAYVESGSIYVSINNDRRKLVKGDIAICTSGDIHYYEKAEISSKILLLVFKPEFFGFPANWPDSHQLACSFIQKDCVAPNELTHIKHLLYSLMEERRSKKEFYDLFVKAKVLELCGSILRYFPTNASDISSKAKNFSKLKTMQEILVYIENNFTEDISLQYLADKFNLDAFNLSKAFNSVTGKNLKTYINTLRIYKAEDIILNSKKPLIHIAMECGFNSIRTFNRAYKGIKGYVPSSIR
jgi:AraC-like DNA-binding protein